MNFMLLGSVITGGESVSTSNANTASGSSFFATSNIGFWVLYIIFIILLFYFLAIRPQKKREKKMVELQADIKIGDWVLLDSGIYGKITDITDQVFIIEFGTNKSVLIPVIKQRVISKGEPNLTISQK